MKIFTLFIIITAFFLNSCARNFYQVPVAQGNIISSSMLSKLEIGLTKAQVRYIMGTPAVIDPFDMNRWDYIGFQIVGDEKSAVVHHIVIFKDNKLVEWKSNNENEVNENLKEKSMLESIKKPEK